MVVGMRYQFRKKKGYRVDLTENISGLRIPPKNQELAKYS